MLLLLDIWEWNMNPLDFDSTYEKKLAACAASVTKSISNKLSGMKCMKK